MTDIGHLWSARQGRGPALEPITTAQASALFSTLVSELFAKDQMPEAFGHDCIDDDSLQGTLGSDPAARLLIETGRDNFLAVAEQSPLWDQDTFLDAVELFGRLVSTGDKNAEGSYDHRHMDCGWHYAAFDREPAFTDYRSLVNRILARYDDGFHLNTHGQVERLVGADLEGLAEPASDSMSLEGTDEEHVQAALMKFRRRDLPSRRDAVRDLADVLERLRPHAKELMGRRDEGPLFDIANNYWIRHNGSGQKREYDHNVWWDWVFHLYLASIRLIQALQARSASEDDSLDELVACIAGATWHKGELGRRLDEVGLDKLLPEAQRRVGLAVGRRCARQTFVVIEDGLRACAASSNLEDWPPAYREGLLDGLFLDLDGHLTVEPATAGAAVRVLLPVADTDRRLQVLVERACSAAFSDALGSNPSFRKAAASALQQALPQVPDGPERTAWARLVDRVGEGLG
ncbi:MAG TPA: hypothetical protein PKD80_04260 [Microthrixaceae bacterium]|nr:hypothetical protein [Microthrixaceae bacterium]HMT25128.1 hypothetical protein [Microthrixaceae bacterium]